MNNLFNGFNGFHSLESIIGLVTASLIIKSVEKCTDTYCKNTDLHDALHDAETLIDLQIDEQIPDHELLDESSTATTVLHPLERSVSDLSSVHTVYNFPVHPTKLAPVIENPNHVRCSILPVNRATI